MVSSVNDKRGLGYIDHVDKFFIRGWAYIVDHGVPHRAHLGLFVGNSLHAVTEASLFRLDMLEPATLEGMVGFEFANPLNSTGLFAENGSICILDENNNPSCRLQQFFFTEKINTQINNSPMTSDFAGNQSGIFIIGAARSGTSALHQVLAKCTGLAAFDEGHLVPLYRLIEETASRYRTGPDILKTMAAFQAPETYWRVALYEYFRGLYGQLFGNRQWIDKTPGSLMIESISFASECWPNAKFIFMKRRAIESIHSALRKFESETFESLCDEWATCMDRWQVMKQAIPGRYVEIDQYDLIAKPEMVGDLLKSFLGLSQSAHDKFIDLIKKYRPERTSSSYEALCLSDTCWSPEQRAYFLERCGPMMNAYGYGYEDDYFQKIMTD